MAFKNIVGHRLAGELLRGAICSGRVASSYVFVGPDGVGKSFVAKTFIKALFCKNFLSASLPNTGMVEDDSCDNCISCKKIDKNNHPDVMMVYSQGKGEQIKIDQIREVSRKVQLKPFESDKKAFIILDADDMKEEAAHAFLKTLEEPPAGSFIILTTSLPQRLSRTILSRCQKIRFGFISETLISDRLQKHLYIDKELAETLAHMSDGRYGLAVSLAQTEMQELRLKIIEGLKNPSLSFINVLSDQSREITCQRLEWAGMWFRDILVYKLTSDKNKLIYLDYKDDIVRQAERFNIDFLQNIINSFLTARIKIKSYVNTDLVLGNLLTQLPI